MAKSGKSTAYRALSDPASSAFRLADYPFYLLYRVAEVYSDVLERLLKPIGMDRPRWRVLMSLAEHNPASLSLIADMAAMKLPTLQKVVQRMAADGLVATAPRATDARVTEVTMTAAGRRALAEIRQQASRAFALGTGNLSDAELMQFNVLLRRIEADLVEAYSAREPTLVPPQTNKVCPVTKPASTPRKKRTARATSSG